MLASPVYGVATFLAIILRRILSSEPYNIAFRLQRWLFHSLKVSQNHDQTIADVFRPSCAHPACYSPVGCVGTMWVYFLHGCQTYAHVALSLTRRWIRMDWTDGTVQASSCIPDVPSDAPLDLCCRVHLHIQQPVVFAVPPCTLNINLL